MAGAGKVGEFTFSDHPPIDCKKVGGGDVNWELRERGGLAVSCEGVN